MGNADKLRGHLDAAEYKSVVLGLIFLKYISDMFEQVHERVEKEGLDDPEDRDVYLAERVFWVPKEARWKNLQDNANLKGMLPGNYGRATLDKRRLGDRVAAAAQDPYLYFWDQAVGQWSRRPALARSMVSRVSFSPDGQLVAAGTYDNRLLVWNVETGRLLAGYSTTRSSLAAVRFSPGGLYIASGGWGGPIRLWGIP